MTFGMPFLLETATMEDACRLCRELGLSFVELNANFPACQAECLHPDELLRLKASYGIDFTFHVEEECDPFAFQGRVRDAWLDTLRQTMALAMAAGMPVINMHLPHGVYITLPGERVYLHARYRDHYLQAAEELRALCEDGLRGSDVRIAIENTDGFPTLRADAGHRTLPRGGECGSALLSGAGGAADPYAWPRRAGQEESPGPGRRGDRSGCPLCLGGGEQRPGGAGNENHRCPAHQRGEAAIVPARQGINESFRRKCEKSLAMPGDCVL